MDAGEVGGQHRVKLRDQAQMFFMKEILDISGNIGRNGRLP